MHEVAEATPSTLPAVEVSVMELMWCQKTEQALPHLILPAAGLPKVCHWTELSVNGLAIEPAVVQALHGLLCIILVAKLYQR